MTMTRGSMQVPRGNQRLDEQPVDGFVRGVLQREGCQIDLFVPELKEPVIGAERLNGLRIQRDVRLARPFRQPLVEFSWRHG